MQIAPKGATLFPPSIPPPVRGGQKSETRLYPGRECTRTVPRVVTHARLGPYRLVCCMLLARLSESRSFVRVVCRLGSPALLVAVRFPARCCELRQPGFREGQEMAGAVSPCC